MSLVMNGPPNAFCLDSYATAPERQWSCAGGSEGVLILGAGCSGTRQTRQGKAAALVRGLLHVLCKAGRVQGRAGEHVAVLSCDAGAGCAGAGDCGGQRQAGQGDRPGLGAAARADRGRQRGGGRGGGRLPGGCGCHADSGVAQPEEAPGSLQEPGRRPLAFPAGTTCNRHAPRRKEKGPRSHHVSDAGPCAPAPKVESLHSRKQQEGLCMQLS